MCDPQMTQMNADPVGIGMGVEALGFGHADDVARGFLQALVGVL